MSTYRNEWPCCGSVTETESWQPEACPICELAAARDDAEVHRIERRKVSEVLAAERAAKEKAEAEAARLRTLLARWVRKWETDMDPTPEMMDDARAALAQEGK